MNDTTKTMHVQTVDDNLNSLDVDDGISGSASDETV